MRIALLAMMILALVAVAACSPRTPAPADSFAIYLLALAITPQQLAMLSHLELGAPFLSASEIAGYTWATHAIELTATGYEKLRSLSVPVSGTAFAVCVGGQPVYAGAFWPGLSSLSFDGVIIDPLRVTTLSPVMHIELGYPTTSYFTGADPRIQQALQSAGKLR